MIIILIDISHNTDNQEIEDLISPSVTNGLIASISIMAQKNTKTHDLQYHGLVTIIPDTVAKEVIKKLNGSQINGRCIDIHEYRNRHCDDDPRICKDQLKELIDKRQSDRRRRHLEIYQL